MKCNQPGPGGKHCTISEQSEAVAPGFHIQEGQGGAGIKNGFWCPTVQQGSLGHAALHASKELTTRKNFECPHHKDIA